MSQIVIQRIESHWQDKSREYRVIADGREVARVGDGATVTFAVEPGKHTICMAIDWGRSKPLEFSVDPEQTIRLECGPNAKPFLALIYALVLFRRWVWLRPANGAAI